MYVCVPLYFSFPNILGSLQPKSVLIKYKEIPVAPLDLLFASYEKLVGNVMFGGCFEHSDHEILVFLIWGEIRKEVS